MRYLDKEAIENISVGAAFLGTGGGGDPYIGKMMALSAIEKYGPVQLISVDEVEEDKMYLPSASMGAPSVMIEKFPKGDEFINAFEKLSQYLNVDEIAGTFPMEAGGVNSMIPIAVAATLQIPMVDCDGMGRAFPELQMTTFHLGGIPVTPMTITDEKGNIGVIDTVDNPWSERIARVVTSEMGATAMVSLYPSNGQQLKENGISNIVSYSEEIGKILNKKNTNNKIEELLNTTNGFELFTGKIIDVTRNVKGGFNFGTAKIEGVEEYIDKNMEVHLQNENLLAVQEGKLLASTPDLVVILDLETLTPVTTEQLQYGKRVRVLGIPCDSKWRTEKGIETVGPRYFGYDYDYQPVEELVSKEVK